MEKGWKEVFMTSQEYQIAIAEALLKDQGINAVVMNQHDSAYQTFGEFRLYVEEHDEAKALELLKELKN